MSENKDLQVAGGKNELAVTDETLISYMDTFGIASKLSQQQKSQFIEVAKAYQLNPFKREIYAVPYGSQLTILTGYEVYIKRAERSGKLNGWSVDYDDIKRVATVVIHRKDWAQPLKHSVFFVEYAQGTPIWKSKPVTMIKKVAIAQAFRLAFSDETGGMPYTSEELPDQMVNPAPIQEKPKAQVKPKVTEVKALADQPLIANPEDVKKAVARIKNELGLEGHTAGMFFQKCVQTKKMSEITVDDLANLNAAIDVELYERKSEEEKATVQAPKEETDDLP